MRLRASLALAPFALVGCSTLPPLPQDTCGNGVVEPEHHESCDTFATAPSTFCRPPGAPSECRFDCDESAGHVCPTGLGCGADNVCRAAAGTFVAAASVGGPSALRLSSADLDGDRRGDLVAETADSVSVQFFGEGATPAEAFRIPVAHAHAVPTRDLTGDAQGDLVLTIGPGIDIWHGNADRTLSPIIFPSFPIGKITERLIPLEMLPDNPGKEMLILAANVGTNVTELARVVARNTSPAVLFALDGNPDNLAGSIAVGNLLEGPSSPCDEIAFAFKAESKVRLYTACRPAAQGGFVANGMGAGAVTLADVNVDAGTIVNVIAGHVDGDAHLDLLIDTTDGVHVAYGLGDGTFHSSLPLPAKGTQDGLAKAFEPTIAGAGAAVAFETPLAMGAIDNGNGGGGGDAVVVPRGILVYQAPGAYAVGARAPEVWTEAVIADLDGSHLGSVAGVTGANVDVYKATGSTLFNRTEYTLEGNGSQLVAGDFDGDLVDDLALSVTTTSDSAGTASKDALTLLFGRALGYPDAPLTIGVLPNIVGIAAGPLEDSLTNDPVLVDDIADLAISIAAADQTRAIAALPGRADRQLTSPFTLVNSSDMTLQDTALHPIGFAIAAGPSAGGARPSTNVACLAANTASSNVTRVWRAPVTSDADTVLDVTTSQIAALTPPLPAARDYERAAIAAFALGPSPTDASTIAVLAPPAAGASGGGSLLLTRDIGSATAAQASHPIGVAAPFRDWKLEACDIDGDGDDDAVLLYADADGRAVSVVKNASSGDLDPESAITIPLPRGDAPVDIACVNLDADAAREIVVLGANGAYASKLDASGASFSPSAQLLGVPGGVAIARGDFDGDGVDDLAIATATGVDVRAGVPLSR